MATNKNGVLKDFVPGDRKSSADAKRSQDNSDRRTVDITQLGEGYNSIRDRKSKLMSVFKGGIKPSKSKPRKDQIISSSTYVVSSAKELQEKFEANAEISIHADASLKAGLAYAQNLAEHELLYVHQFRQVKQVLSFDPSSNLSVEKVREHSKENMDDFFRLFGDSYISSLYCGVYYTILIKATASTKEVAQSARADLAALKVASFNSNAAKKLKTKNISYTVQIIGKGVEENEMPGELGDLILEQVKAHVEKYKKFFTSSSNPDAYPVIDFDIGYYRDLNLPEELVGDRDPIEKADTYKKKLKNYISVARKLKEAINVSDLDESEDDFERLNDCYNFMKQMDESLGKVDSISKIIKIIKDNKPTLIIYKKLLQTLADKIRKVEKIINLSAFELRKLRGYVVDGAERGSLPYRYSLTNMRLDHAKEISVSLESSAHQKPLSVKIGAKAGLLKESKGLAKTMSWITWPDSTVPLGSRIPIQNDIIQANAADGLFVLCGDGVESTHKASTVKVTITYFDKNDLQSFLEPISPVSNSNADLAPITPETRSREESKEKAESEQSLALRFSNVHRALDTIYDQRETQEQLVNFHEDDYAISILNASRAKAQELGLVPGQQLLNVHESARIDSEERSLNLSRQDALSIDTEDSYIHVERVLSRSPR